MKAELGPHGPRQREQPLGRHQIISQSQELSGRAREEHVDQFEKSIPDKQATIKARNGNKDLKLFALCCGEINVLKVRNVIKRDKEVKEANPQVPGAGPALLKADIVVNPTHDRMSDIFGTLNAKRLWLSQAVDGRARVYISASNWNSKGRNGRKQSPDSETLHTVYFSGRRQTMMPLPGQGYVYRECEVPL